MKAQSEMDAACNASPKPELSRLLLTAREARHVLAIGERKLWELTNRREIPCVRIGRSVRYSPRDLEAWIERQKGSRR